MEITGVMDQFKSNVAAHVFLLQICNSTILLDVDVSRYLGASA